MRIHFLSNRTFKSHCFTYPLRVFSSSLKDHGVSVKVFYQPRRSLFRCDILCIVGNHFTGSKTLGHKQLVSELEGYRSRVGRLVWCDVTDSTGTTAFHVLPVVDLYLKNQLLRDRTAYTEPFYGLRSYTDYYHRHLGLQDETESRRPVAREADLGKLAVSWNIGLGDYTSFGPIGRRARIFWPWPTYNNTSHCPPDAPRGIDASYRASTRYKRATVSYQRQETRSRLLRLASESRHSIVTEGKLSYKQYRAELDRSRIVPSPFGLCEICLRDFECFLSGGVLFKPSMEHLETWPDYFVSGRTYASHDWSFSDFDAALSGLLDSPDRCRELAGAGQEFYLSTRSLAFGETFARRFGSLMRPVLNERATPPRTTALAGSASSD